MSILASRLAALYSLPETKIKASEFDVLLSWIDAEYAAIPCSVAFTGTDVTLAHCVEWCRRYDVLLISTANSSHPFLSKRANARFRAVHDWHHIMIGADSTLRGEIAAFRYAKRSAPRNIHWLLFSEIVLQAAACLHHGAFQPQRLVDAWGIL